MKLISFKEIKGSKDIKIGAHCGDYIVDFSPSSLPKDMLSFIELGDKALSIANDLIVSQQHIIPVEEITLTNEEVETITSTAESVEEKSE